jgi:FO synthase
MTLITMRGEARTGCLLDQALGGKELSPEQALELFTAPNEDLPLLLAAAGELRNQGKGQRVSFSRKIFIPLTTLCRDYCGYCTFRRDPGDPGAHTMTPDEVLALCRAGETLGVKEALFSLGDKPEARFPEHRKALRRFGYRTTLEYLRAVSELVVTETSLLPHANPGVMRERDLAALKEVSVSMGLMLESTSERLLRPGLAHDLAPDKHPKARLRTLELAGKLQIPFTTGLLIGIGETTRERIETLYAIRRVHARYGHIQEVIIQNFRAKPGIPMRDHSEPTLEDLKRTIAISRLILGREMNIQAPPNLSANTYHLLIDAGLNDWGGISPLTIDLINPEAPWPHIMALREATEAAGFELRERLAVYPEYVSRPAFIHETLRAKAAAYVDGEGFVRPEKELGRRWN